MSPTAVEVGDDHVLPELGVLPDGFGEDLAVALQVHEVPRSRRVQLQHLALQHRHHVRVLCSVNGAAAMVSSPSLSL